MWRKVRGGQDAAAALTHGWRRSSRTETWLPIRNTLHNVLSVFRDGAKKHCLLTRALEPLSKPSRGRTARRRGFRVSFGHANRTQHFS